MLGIELFFWDLIAKLGQYWRAVRKYLSAALEPLKERDGPSVSPKTLNLLIGGGAAILIMSLFYSPLGLFRGNPFQPNNYEVYFTRIGTLLLAALGGLAVGTFFSPLLKRFRVIIWTAFGAGVVYYGIVGPYPMADTLDYGLGGLAFLIALGIGLQFGKSPFASLPAVRRRPTSFGSAQWATYTYLADKGMFGDEGFILGEFDVGEKHTAPPIRYNGARHLLTVSPTRSGKGVSSIIPNLLTYKGSALIIDPKGENALITALRRGKGDRTKGIAGLGQNVIVLDPWDIAASKLGLPQSSFNPLDWIREGDPDAAENAFILADALVISENEKSENRFWDEEAKALLTGVILYVAIAPEEAQHRHLGRVRDIIILDEFRLKKKLTEMYKHPHPVIKSMASRTALKEDKLLGSVLAGAQAHTHFLDSPRIRASLSRSDFQFEELKSKQTSIYLILPADRLSTFGRWLRLLIQQAITVNARNIEVKPERPILFLLDEMPTLGKLPALEQAYGLMAGFGMQLWGIAQDLSQLAKVYGEFGWQTFISNSGVIQYFGSRDEKTAEYFSTLCGVTTIEVHNFSWAVGKAVSLASSFSSSFGGGGGSSSSSSSTTDSDSWTRTTGTNESQRKLAYPDELMVMKENRQVIFVENLDPIPAKKIVWYEDGELKKHGVNLYEPTIKLAPATPSQIKKEQVPPEVKKEPARTEPKPSPVSKQKKPEPIIQPAATASQGATLGTWGNFGNAGVTVSASISSTPLSEQSKKDEDTPPWGDVDILGQ